MSAIDAQDIAQWQEALRWIGRAVDDIRAARSLLRDGVDLQAAFHVQQAIEKCLKALLVVVCKDVRKTHDLDTLAELVRHSWPNLIPEPFPLNYVSYWYIVSRYPGDDDAGPAVGEIQVALADAVALLSNVFAHVPDYFEDETKYIRGIISR